MSYLLSICIPSYNRASFIPQTLESIFSQYDERVEVVICDNGSLDETPAIGRAAKERFSCVCYFRFEENVGPDRCFLKSVELASGKYCWLLGDDDIIEPGAIALILGKLEEDPYLSGITVNRNAYDAKLLERWEEPERVLSMQDILFDDSEICLETLFLLFGFLSAQIVHRKQWLSITEREDVTPYYTAYVLIYVIGRMIQKNPHWLYVHTPCIGWRSGNDSFVQELGRYRRFELDVIGYHKIVTGLCKTDPILYKRIMNQVCKVHLFAHLCDMKLHYRVKNMIFLSLKTCLPYIRNISSFWYKLLPVILTPRLLLKALRKGYHLFFKKRRARDSSRSLGPISSGEAHV